MRTANSSYYDRILKTLDGLIISDSFVCTEFKKLHNYLSTSRCIKICKEKIFRDRDNLLWTLENFDG